MNREECVVYCLLYAIDAANIKKQNLVQMALKSDSIAFVKIYNIIQQHDEATRKTWMASIFGDYNKKEMIEEIKNTFLTELEPSLQESICEYL